MIELHGVHPKYTVEVENDRNEVVTFTPRTLLIRTDNRAELERIMQIAEADGWRELKCNEYSPNAYEKPDFIGAVRL